MLLAPCLSALFAIMATGCNTSGCTDNQNSIPLAGFYSYETGEAVSLTGVEIGGVGAPGDSLLCTDSQTVNTIYLPFRSKYPSATFYIRYLQEQVVAYNLVDTLRFQYTAEPYFASEECGAMYRYRITGLYHTKVLIDSVAITDSLVTNIDIERIKIYFNTSTDENEPTTE